MTGALQRLRRAAGAYPAPVWRLIAGTAIHSGGFAFFWPFITLYVHVVLGQSLALAGLVLMAQSAAGIGGAAVGGLLFDRWGGRRPMVWGVGLSVALMAGMALAQGFWPFAVLVALFGFASSLVSPSLYAYAATIWPEGGRQAFNALYVARNAGVAFGTLAGGLVAAVSLHLTFVAAALLFVAFWVMAQWGYRGAAFDRVQRAPSAAGPARRPLRASPGVLLLMVGLGLDWMAYTQWQTTTAAYMYGEGFSLPAYSVLWTLNGTLILAGQPVTSWVARRWPAVRHQLLVGSSLFCAAYALLALSHAYAGYVVAMVLGTLGEMLVWPAVPTAAARLAPVGQEGRYQGWVASATSAGRMVGPLVGGLLVAGVARPVFYGWMVGAFLVALGAYWLYGQLAARPTGLDRPGTAAAGS